MHGTYAAAIPFQGGSYGIGILQRDTHKYKIIPMPGREENVPSLLQNLKIMYFVPTPVPHSRRPALAVPLIEKALQNVDKPIFMAGDMNSAPASVPQLELANILPPSMTQPLILSGRPSQPMYRLHLRLFQEWVSV